MGCCNERIRPDYQNKEINYEEALEKVRIVKTELDSQFSKMQVELIINQDEFFDSSVLAVIQTIIQSLVVFSIALEDKILENPLNLSVAIL